MHGRHGRPGPWFQHTAARRRLAETGSRPASSSGFQHTAARRRLVGPYSSSKLSIPFQHTAARRRLDDADYVWGWDSEVSTHSRPKAAGTNKRQTSSVWPFQHTAARRRLGVSIFFARADRAFQHTAARRRLADKSQVADTHRKVSTHSRPKAAGRTI